MARVVFAGDSGQLELSERMTRAAAGGAGMSAMGGSSASRAQWVPSDSQRAAASAVRKALSAADRTTAMHVAA